MISKFVCFKRKPMTGIIGKSLAGWVNAKPKDQPESFEQVCLCIVDGILYARNNARVWEPIPMGTYLDDEGREISHTPATMLAKLKAVPADFRGAPTPKAKYVKKRRVGKILNSRGRVC